MMLLMTAPAFAANNPVRVTVDCSEIVGKPPQLWGHVNVSRHAPPPKELCPLIEKQFGRPQVTRCWLMLDQMWDYRTDTYRFNYEINKDYYVGDPNKIRYGVPGRSTGMRYYDYLDPIGRHSETVLMNIRCYFIDSKHSNCLTVPDYPGGLEEIEEFEIKAAEPILLSTELETMV